MRGTFGQLITLLRAGHGDMNNLLWSKRTDMVALSLPRAKCSHFRENNKCTDESESPNTSSAEVRTSLGMRDFVADEKVGLLFQNASLCCEFFIYNLG